MAGLVAGGGKASPTVPSADLLSILGLRECRFVCAPMVDQSELPFRMLCRRHGVKLCFTPMIHSRLFVESEKYREDIFTTCGEDRPLVAQFCGNKPETLLNAAKLIEARVDAVDLNLGCPQGIARRGFYGAFLLEEFDLLKDIVSTLSSGLSIPVTCKIRLLPDMEKTLQLARLLQSAGCALLTVHGRTKIEKKQQIGATDWAAIRAIKDDLKIPVLSNGGIETASDIEKCLDATGADGVMSSEALLENPAMLRSEPVDQVSLALEYLEICGKYPPKSLKVVRAHLFKMLFGGLQRKEHHDLRSRLASAREFTEIVEIVNELKSRLKEPLYGGLWYRRHRDKIKAKQQAKNTTKETSDEEMLGGLFN